MVGYQLPTYTFIHYCTSLPKLVPIYEVVEYLGVFVMENCCKDVLMKYVWAEDN